MLAVISFDAVSRPLLDRMMAQGSLPNCAELLRRGTTYAMESTPLHASVYRSLYTGFSLSTHGAYYPFVWRASDQRVQPADALNPEDSVFARLERAGKRILVIDPPECGRFEPRSGIAFCGWQFTSRFVLPEWYSSKRIARVLKDKFGAPKSCNEVFGKQSAPRLRAMHDLLQSASQRLADATAACLKEGEFDLLWVSFVAPHIAGHHLWRAPLDSEPDAPDEESEALAGIYRKADQALGQILAALPPKTDVIFLSPNGLGAETSRADLLPAMLTRVLEGHSVTRTVSHAGRGLWRLRAIVPTAVRALVADALSERLALSLTTFFENTGTDRKTARAFALPSDGAGFVRLNLKGRERHGIVDPIDAEKLLDEIAAGLATFVEPSGEKAIASFLRSAELDVAGPKSSSLPDLVALWSKKPEAGLRRVTSPRFGEVLRDGVGSGRLGNHCEGAWACVVPAESRKLAPDLGPVRAIDVTSTVCALMGVPCEDLPGRSLLG
ncbi:MAG: alkaline phosphatase family protein [Burkholderiales bacterium]